MGNYTEKNPTGVSGEVKLTFIAALEHSGTPSLYFPVTKPHASGDQVIAPTPERDQWINLYLFDNEAEMIKWDVNVG